jgi:hypothetical protein
MERNNEKALDKIIEELDIDLKEPGFFIRHAWVFLELLVIMITIIILVFL